MREEAHNDRVIMTEHLVLGGMNPHAPVRVGGGKERVDDNAGELFSLALSSHPNKAKPNFVRNNEQPRRSFFPLPNKPIVNKQGSNPESGVAVQGQNKNARFCDTGDDQARLSVCLLAKNDDATGAEIISQNHTDVSHDVSRKDIHIYLLPKQATATGDVSRP